MATRKRNFDTKRLKSILPYVVTGVLTLVLVFVGSLDKRNSSSILSLNAFAESNYKVSVDQLSELYVVADLSDALGLASAPDVATNFVITTAMYEVGQTSASGKIEKPNITNITASRGVIEHVVGDGESMESIAAKYGISTDDIRWSNDRKTTDVSVGDLLYIPSASGIVYTVKSGDTADSIAEKYGGTAAEIIALNDLEVTGVTEGMRILIRGGSLPETERPEYVPPAPVVQTYYYTYLGSNAGRLNMEVLGYFYNLGGPYAAGQCTQWAWYKWHEQGREVPMSWGNAYSWGVSAAAMGYQVDHTPAAGAIFQSSSGWYGHVGYVESVNPDGSIVASEMNYGYQPFRAIRSTIPAASAAVLFYIH
ncbi:LysM peptidoglycan-binding domain-containing protein [Candidatus Saccharibacteria bacterium]|nr:LysM peptidoglycan-binding domain-containing protein [Candidatus Saccharibacteria bacterium]